APAARPGSAPGAPPAQLPPSAVSKPVTPPAGVPAAPVAPSPLVAESRWLRDLFSGTPVAVGDETDGAVLVTVPMTYSFDATGAAAPKPPLKAVLDKVSQSLLRQPNARVQLGAPEPGASQRTAAMRAQLLGKGVVTTRTVLVTTDDSNSVVLRLLPGPK
ncbi:MAG TPA: hypothetical protein VLA16_23025, partial [Ideonella sp.]|nr:hypothetical protein [Ideonella sp.]